MQQAPEGSDLQELSLIIEEAHKQGSIETLQRILTEPIPPKYSALTHFYLGCLFQEAEQFDLAIEHYKKSLLQRPNNPFVIFNLALIKSEKLGEQTEAEKMYKMVLSLDPNFIEAYINLGNIYQDTDRLQEAADAYKKAISIRTETEDSDMMKFKSLAYKNLGILLFDQGKPKLALSNMQMAHTYDPSNTEIVLELGEIYSKLNQPAKALECYMLSLQHNPSLASSYVSIGDICSNPDNKELRDVAKAIKHYSVALKLQPTWTSLHFVLGMLFDEVGKPEQALEHLKQTIETEKDEGLVYSALLLTGKILSSKDPKQAIELFNRANSIINTPSLLVSISECHLILGDKDEAIRGLEQLIQLDPTPPYIANLCRIKLSKLFHGNTPISEIPDAELLQSLEADLDRGLSMAPNDAGLTFIKGKFCFFKQDFESSYELLEKVCVLPEINKEVVSESLAGPSNTDEILHQLPETMRALAKIPDCEFEKIWYLHDCLHLLGKMKTRVREFSAASEAFRQALLFDSENVETLVELGVSLFEEGKADESISYLRRVVVTNPQSTIAAYHLANVLGQNEKFDQALEYYNRALKLQPQYELQYKILHNLAVTHHKMGNIELYNQTLKEAEKILEENPHLLQKVESGGIQFASGFSFDEIADGENKLSQSQLLQLLQEFSACDGDKDKIDALMMQFERAQNEDIKDGKIRVMTDEEMDAAIERISPEDQDNFEKLLEKYFAEKAEKRQLLPEKEPQETISFDDLKFNVKAPEVAPSFDLKEDKLKTFYAPNKKNKKMKTTDE